MPQILTLKTPFSQWEAKVAAKVLYIKIGYLNLPNLINVKFVVLSILNYPKIKFSYEPRDPDTGKKQDDELLPCG